MSIKLICLLSAITIPCLAQVSFDKVEIRSTFASATEGNNGHLTIDAKQMLSASVSPSDGQGTSRHNSFLTFRNSSFKHFGGDPADQRLLRFDVGSQLLSDHQRFIRGSLHSV